MSLRVVLDTSVLMSAALRTGSVPHQAMLQAFAMSEVYASVETLAELERVFERKRFDAYLARPLRREFVALIRQHSLVVFVAAKHLDAVVPRCRDAKDDQFLALALAADAQILVSGDEDLLAMHPWNDLEIVTAADFLARGKAE